MFLSCIICTGSKGGLILVSGFHRSWVISRIWVSGSVAVSVDNFIQTVCCLYSFSPQFTHLQHCGVRKPLNRSQWGVSNSWTTVPTMMGHNSSQVLYRYYWSIKNPCRLTSCVIKMTIDKYVFDYIMLSNSTGIDIRAKTVS